MGDGTGCDNMTAVLVKLKPNFGQTETGGSKRQAADDSTEDRTESKKLKLDNDVGNDSQESEKSKSAAAEST
jgi:hypothetical protein